MTRSRRLVGVCVALSLVSLCGPALLVAHAADAIAPTLLGAGSPEPADVGERAAEEAVCSGDPWICEGHPGEAGAGQPAPAASVDSVGLALFGVGGAAVVLGGGGVAHALLRRRG